MSGVKYAVVLLRREHLKARGSGGGSGGAQATPPSGCDNSPERVRQFLACRLGEFTRKQEHRNGTTTTTTTTTMSTTPAAVASPPPQQHGQQQGQQQQGLVLPVLFYFTDEKDAGYLRRLRAVAGEFAATAVHGDAEARAHLTRLGVGAVEEDRHLAYVALLIMYTIHQLLFTYTLYLGKYLFI